MSDSFKLVDDSVEVTKIVKINYSETDLLQEKQWLEEEISNLQAKLVDINAKLNLVKKEI